MSHSTTHAGVIVTVQGTAWVVRGGSRLQIKPGTAVESGDSLLTENGASINVRFADDAEIRLGPSTQVAVKDFFYDAGGKHLPSFDLGIAHGLVRSISGKVVEQNPEAFKLSSPLATLGIRGMVTAHRVEAKEEFHAVLVLSAGHTVTIATADGRSLVLDRADMSVAIQSGNLAPLEALEMSGEQLEAIFSLLLREDMLHSSESSTHLLADPAAFALLGEAALLEPGGGFTPLETLGLLFNPLAHSEGETSPLILTWASEFDTPSSPAPSLSLGETWYGTSGADTHTGTPYNDHIYGMGGNDQLNGGAGNDYIETTTLIPGMGVGSPVVYGGAGNDTLVHNGDLESGGTLTGDVSTLNLGETGGSNSITVNGDLNGGIIYGNASTMNGALATSGNTISINGDVSNGGTVYGSASILGNGSAAHGGDNTITIDGDVAGHVYGTSGSMHNNSTSDSNTITVTGNVVGSGFVTGDSNIMNASTGGNSTITVGGMSGSSNIYGDALQMDNGSVGGDDMITVGMLSGGIIYGDAATMNDTSQGGNDTITIDDFSGFLGATLYGDAGAGTSTSYGDDWFHLGSGGMSFFSSSDNFTLTIGDFNNGADHLDLAALVVASGMVWGAGLFAGANATATFISGGATLNVVLTGINAASLNQANPADVHV